MAATQRVLRPVGRRHGGHQRERGGRHRDRAPAQARIGKVYAGRNGIIGALTEDLIDTSRESARAIAALMHTPSGAFGSCRYKLKGIDESRAQYERLIDVFRAHDIGYFFYNGGNDSADTCLKVAQVARVDRLSAGRRARAEDRRQRSRGDRQLPGLRLGREVRRDVDARGGVRRRVDGEDVDQGVRARSDGPPCGLDHRGGGNGRGRGDADSARAAVPGDRVRRGEVPRRGRRQDEGVRLLLRRRVGGPAGCERQADGGGGHARRVRSRATGRRRAADRLARQGQARLQVPLGGRRLSAARRAPPGIEDRPRRSRMRSAGRRCSTRSPARTR